MTESRIFLQRAKTNKLVEASLLDEVTDRHLAMWEGSWCPAMEAYCEGRTARNQPEDHHWDWKWKADEWRPLLGYHSFAIVCEKDLQGLMLVSDFKSARCQRRPLRRWYLRRNCDWNFGSPKRDADPLESWSLQLDLQIVLKTILVVLKKQNAY